MTTGAREQRGTVLLAVLWLSVALTTIAMTTAYLVRTEAASVSNHVASERAALLARGGIGTAIYALMRAGASEETGQGVTQKFEPGQRWLRYEFQEGTCAVEIVPENAKLSVNSTSQEQLAALFASLGSSADESRELAEAIVHWRTPRASSVASALDLHYASLDAPYEARHAPFTDLDELLGVKGMTREVYFGRQLVDDRGSRTPPLADLLTTEQNFGGVNVNYAALEILRILPGWDETLATRVVEARSRAPFRTLNEFAAAVPEAAALTSVAPVTVAPSPAYTLTATARASGSEVRRTVRARIRFDRNSRMGVRTTGWWQDWPWSSAGASSQEGSRS